MRNGMLLAMGAVAVALVAPARADDPGRRSTGIEDPARVGRPGENGTERTPQVGATASATRELSGTVVKADRSMLYLEHMGAIVAMKLDGKTRFTGAGVSTGSDLKEGEEVRASFTIEKQTTNVARRVEVARAKDRAPSSTGTTGTPPGDERLPPGHPPLPPDRGPGTPSDRTPPVPTDPRTPGPADPGSPPVKY